MKRTTADKIVEFCNPVLKLCNRLIYLVVLSICLVIDFVNGLLDKIRKVD